METLKLHIKISDKTFSKEARFPKRHPSSDNLQVPFSRDYACNHL